MITRLLIAAATIAFAPPAFAEPSAKAPKVETLASFPNGAFLENLLVRADGAIVFTSYFDKTLMLRRPDGELSVLAKLPAHPVGLAPLGDGYVVSAHGVPFTQGQAFLSTNKILQVAADGRVLKTVSAPDARFLNGVLRQGEDAYLIADSIAGAIWRYRPSDGQVTAWLRDERLAPDPAAQPFRPGANGLKAHGGRLFVSNSSKREITTVDIGADGAPSGSLRLYASPGVVDDFVLAKDGTLYGATHGAQLLAVAPDGAVRTMMAEGCDGCTAVAFTGPDEAALAVLTTGDLLDGGKKPARILTLQLQD